MILFNDMFVGKKNAERKTLLELCSFSGIPSSTAEASKHTCHQFNSLYVLQPLLAYERAPGLKADGMPDRGTNPCRTWCILGFPRRSQEVSDLLPIREVGGKHFAQHWFFFHI